MLFFTFLVVCATLFRSCESALYDILSVRLLPETSYFRGVTMLSNGDAVVVGYVDGVVGTAYGLNDFIIQRSTPAGEVVWTKQWGSASWDYAIYVVSDAADNIYVSGTSQASFDGNTHYGGGDCAVFKLDSAGNKLFSSQFGTAGSESASAISIDTTRDLLYATGYTIMDGVPDAGFVAKLNLTTGAVLKNLQLPSSAYPFGSGTDSAGGVWIGGFSLAPSYFGVNTDGGAFVQRFDADLNSNFVDFSSGEAYHFSMDANDNKYLSGLHGSDAFVTRYNSAGVKVWTKIFGGNGDEGAMCSFADLTTGRLYVTGKTQSASFLGNTNPHAADTTFLVVLSVEDGSVLYSSLYGNAGAHSGSMSVVSNGPITYFSGASNGNFLNKTVTVGGEHGFVVALTTPADPFAAPTLAPTSPPSCVQWALGDYGQSCSATCAGLQRVCKPKYFESITTQETFYDIVASAVNVRAGGGAIGSPEFFCSQATSASTEVNVPAVLSVVLSAAGNDPVRRTCTYPTTTATDCDAELPMSSSFRRFCPCVNHNCDDSWYLGYSGASCGATCSSVQRTCDATRLSEVVTNTSFSAMVASTTALDTNGPVAESAAAFCTLGTNLLDVATAPAALTFVQGSTNQTLCAFPTSVEQLHGDCDVAFTGAFPAQRFCNCRVPAHIPHRKLITKVESSAAPAFRLRGAKHV